MYRSDGTQRVVLVVFNPTLVSYADLLRCFGNHDPTQGMRQGNDWEHNIDPAFTRIQMPKQRQHKLVGMSTTNGSKRQVTAASRQRFKQQLSSTTPRSITSNIWIKTRRVIAVLAARAWPAVLAQASRPKLVTAHAKRDGLVETDPDSVKISSENSTNGRIDTHDAVAKMCNLRTPRLRQLDFVVDETTLGSNE